MIPEGSNSQLASDEVIYVTHFAPHISISIGEVLVCVVSQLSDLLLLMREFQSCLRLNSWLVEPVKRLLMEMRVRWRG